MCIGDPNKYDSTCPDLALLTSNDVVINIILTIL